jgi:GxxExxY protein
MMHNEISAIVVDSAIKVHKRLGPGLLESAYRECLVWELRQRGLSVHVEVPVPLRYEGVKLDFAYRLDVLVENRVVVECKALLALLPVHQAQLLSYLKLSDKRLGLLFNFHELKLKNGIVRLVNGHFEE